MDSSHILSQLEQLDDEIDDLEENLEPLLKSALSETTSKLPLLDNAKLYVLVTYAIESVLFSYLRLHGIKAREHPVFTELTRVKQYFDKIKNAETPSRPPNMAVDKSAVGRMIKHGLSGNEKYDTERAERIAKEKAKAHIKFNELSKKRKVDKSEEEEEEEEEDESSSSDSEPEFIGKDSTEEELAGLEEVEEEQPKPSKTKKRSKKKRKSLSGEATPSGSITNSSDEKVLKDQKKASKDEIGQQTTPFERAKKKAMKVKKEATTKPRQVEESKKPLDKAQKKAEKQKRKKKDKKSRRTETS